MDDLIERLEKATGPDRELDAEIAVSLRVSPEPGNDEHWAVKNFPQWTASKSGRVYAMHSRTKQRGPHWQSPNYTASIDAALTLYDDPAQALYFLHRSIAQRSGDLTQWNVLRHFLCAALKARKQSDG